MNRNENTASTVKKTLEAVLKRLDEQAKVEKLLLDRLNALENNVKNKETKKRNEYFKSSNLECKWTATAHL